jgi:hypothetical protein
MNDFKDIILYGKKSFSDILKEIHQKTQDKEEEIKQLIANLKPLITTPGDAVMIVPLIKSYIDVSVKNDDNLIKMAMIVQKAMSANKTNEDGSLGLSEDEKEQLLDSVKKLNIV